MRYPRWFVKIVCCFIPKEKKRIEKGLGANILWQNKKG